MPVWAFIPLILVAMLACPVSMWVMGKVTRRKMSCAACEGSTQETHIHTVEGLEARKAALEQEIAAVTRQIGAGRQAADSTVSGVGR